MIMTLRTELLGLSADNSIRYELYIRDSEAGIDGVSIYNMSDMEFLSLVERSGNELRLIRNIYGKIDNTMRNNTAQ